MNQNEHEYRYALPEDEEPALELAVILTKKGGLYTSHPQNMTAIAVADFLISAAKVNLARAAEEEVKVKESEDLIIRPNGNGNLLSSVARKNGHG